MKRFVRLICKRGVGSALSLLLGIASILVGVAVGNPWDNPWISGCLYLVGALLVILAGACYFIGPADESSGEAAEKPVDPNPNATSRGNISKDDRVVGMKVPPNTPVKINGIPPNTSVNVSASEELDSDGGEGEGDEPNDR